MKRFSITLFYSAVAMALICPLSIGAQGIRGSRALSGSSNTIISVDSLNEGLNLCWDEAPEDASFAMAISLEHLCRNILAQVLNDQQVMNDQQPISRESIKGVTDTLLSGKFEIETNSKNCGFVNPFGSYIEELVGYMKEFLGIKIEISADGQDYLAHWLRSLFSECVTSIEENKETLTANDIRTWFGKTINGKSRRAL